jgi:hypothetical protein
MEILFIWLYNYKNIKEQGFNFSSEYIFNVKKNSKDKYELTISKNNKFIPNFFEKRNILNVTAIIGQNGSGKSNILDFIKNSLPEGFSEIESQAIIAFRLKGDIDKKIILVPKANYGIDVVQVETNFEIFHYSSKMAKEIIQRYDENYSNAEYVFYSNIFDLKDESMDWAGLHNLSTIALVNGDLSEQDERQLIGNKGSYDRFRTSEIRRNIQFLLSDYTNLLDEFRLPEYLFIEVLDNDLKYFMHNANDDVQEVIGHFQKEILLSKNNRKKWFLNNLYLATFLNVLIVDRRFSIMSNHIPIIRFSKDDSIKNYVYKFFKYLPSFKFKNEYSNQKYLITNHIQKSKIAIEFFNYVENLIENKSFLIEERVSVDRKIIKYFIKENAYEELTKFLKLYVGIKGLTDFLDFNWRNLSSGEQSLFTFVSRFYHLKHNQIQHEDLKKNMVILVDEGDIYFHPAWQKKYFKMTINYLSELFKDHNIQLIFTSNTPFITSDLPKSNIIFIEKKNKISISVQSVENDRAETFGGNIHTLFADSFYLDGALMGDFAKDRIDKIIKYLKSETTVKREDYKKTIDIIGEPILKRKLQEMWIDKFGADEEIEILKKRIIELEKMKK